MLGTMKAVPGGLAAEPHAPQSVPTDLKDAPGTLKAVPGALVEAVPNNLGRA